VVVTASNADGSCPVTSDPVTQHINAPVKADLAAFSQTDCSGAGSVTATASGGTGSYTFTFKVNGATVTTGITGSGATRTLALAAQLDGKCRTIVVSAVDSNTCSSTPTSPGSDTRSFSQCVVKTDC
jgi:hypothetical protein